MNNNSLQHKNRITDSHKNSPFKGNLKNFLQQKRHPIKDVSFFYLSTLPSRKSTDTSKCSAMATSECRDGSLSPRSYRLTASGASPHSSDRTFLLILFRSLKN